MPMIHTAERNGFSVQLSRKQKKAGKRKQADDKANSPIFRVTADEAALPQLTSATNVLTLTPFLNDSTPLAATNIGVTIYKWRCGSTTDSTTIPTKYLPGSCRG